MPLIPLLPALTLLLAPGGPASPSTHPAGGVPGLLGAPAGEPPQDASRDARLARADTLLLSEHLPLKALERYRDLLAEDPHDPEALWRAARACAFLGVLAPQREVEMEWYRAGSEYGERAQEGDPEGLDALYWRLANLGLWAQKERSPLEVLRLARLVRYLADQALRRDPDHAGARNAMGMFHYRVLSLNPAARAIARVLAPSALRRIRWTDAAAHLRRAVALEPDNVLYRVDYGRALLWHGDTLQAREELERALSLPVDLPTDPAFKEKATRLLMRAGG